MTRTGCISRPEANTFYVAALRDSQANPKGAFYPLGFAQNMKQYAVQLF